MDWFSWLPDSVQGAYVSSMGSFLGATLLLLSALLGLRANRQKHEDERELGFRKELYLSVCEGLGRAAAASINHLDLRNAQSALTDEIGNFVSKTNQVFLIGDDEERFALMDLTLVLIKLQNSAQLKRMEMEKRYNLVAFLQSEIDRLTKHKGVLLGAFPPGGALELGELDEQINELAKTRNNFQRLYSDLLNLNLRMLVEESVDSIKLSQRTILALRTALRIKGGKATAFTEKADKYASDLVKMTRQFIANAQAVEETLYDGSTPPS